MSASEWAVKFAREYRDALYSTGVGATNFIKQLIPGETSIAGNTIKYGIAGTQKIAEKAPQLATRYAENGKPLLAKTAQGVAKVAIPAAGALEGSSIAGGILTVAKAATGPVALFTTVLLNTHRSEKSLELINRQEGDLNIAWMVPTSQEAQNNPAVRALVEKYGFQDAVKAQDKLGAATKVAEARVKQNGPPKEGEKVYAARDAASGEFNQQVDKLSPEAIRGFSREYSSLQQAKAQPDSAKPEGRQVAITANTSDMPTKRPNSRHYGRIHQTSAAILGGIIADVPGAKKPPIVQANTSPDSALRKQAAAKQAPIAPG